MCKDFFNEVHRCVFFCTRLWGELADHIYYETTEMCQTYLAGLFYDMKYLHFSGMQFTILAKQRHFQPVILSINTFSNEFLHSVEFHDHKYHKIKVRKYCTTFYH